MADFYLLDRAGFGFQKPVKIIANAPPASNTVGQAVLVGDTGSGTFSSFDNKIAVCITAGDDAGAEWSFSEAPAEGWFVYDQDTSKFYLYKAAAWAAYEETSDLTKTLGATQQFLIDAATTDHTGNDPIFKLDVDVSNGSVRAIGIDMDVTTELGTGKVMYGIELIVDGMAGDHGDSFIKGITLASNGTSGGNIRGIEIDGNFDLGIYCQSLSTFNAGIQMSASELKLDADGDTSITADTDDQIDFKCANADQIILIDGKLYPHTDNDIDLGDSTHEFKDLYIDGISYIDQVNVATNIYFEALGGNAHIIKPEDETSNASNLQLLGGHATAGDVAGGALVLDGGDGIGTGANGNVEIATNRGGMVFGTGGTAISKMEYDGDLNELIITTV